MTIQEQITSTLKKHHTGHSKAISRKELLTIINLFGFNVSDREFRDIVKDMVCNEGSLIGTSADNGYFWVESEEDLEIAKKSILSHAYSIIERAKQLENSFKQAKSGWVQGTML